jgi:uncharacterized protein YegJ (DUF2314 family)
MKYTKRQLESLDTIEQAWDGDELKIWKDDVKVWLTHPENRKYNGDYTIERLINGRWEQENCLFE